MIKIRVFFWSLPYVKVDTRYWFTLSLWTLPSKVFVGSILSSRASQTYLPCRKPHGHPLAPGIFLSWIGWMLRVWWLQRCTVHLQSRNQKMKPNHVNVKCEPSWRFSRQNHSLFCFSCMCMCAQTCVCNQMYRNYTTPHPKNTQSLNKKKLMIQIIPIPIHLLYISTPWQGINKCPWICPATVVGKHRWGGWRCMARTSEPRPHSPFSWQSETRSNLEIKARIQSSKIRSSSMQGGLSFHIGRCGTSQNTTNRKRYSTADSERELGKPVVAEDSHSSSSCLRTALPLAPGGCQSAEVEIVAFSKKQDHNTEKDAQNDDDADDDDDVGYWLLVTVSPLLLLCSSKVPMTLRSQVCFRPVFPWWQSDGQCGPQTGVQSVSVKETHAITLMIIMFTMILGRLVHHHFRYHLPTWGEFRDFMINSGPGK